MQFCVGVFYNKVVGPQNCNFIKKRLNHRIFSWEFCELFKKTYFVEDVWTAGSETPLAFLRTPFLKEHLQWLLLTISGLQLATLFFKRDYGKDVYLWILQNFYKHLLREDIWMTALWILRSFSDDLFYRAPLGNYLFYVHKFGNCLFYIHILRHAFCLHFLRIHHFFRIHHKYFFQRGFESVLAQFLLGNINGK